MTHSFWTYTGILDFFSVDETDKIKFLNIIQEEIYEAGGEVQIQAVNNLLDTDRYKIVCKITNLSKPLSQYLYNLSKLLPSDHPVMVIEGYNHYDLEREDLIIKHNKIYIKKYAFTEIETLEYNTLNL